MFRSSISLLRSLQPLQLMSTHPMRSMNDMSNRRNPFTKQKLPALPEMEIITMKDRDMDKLIETHLFSQKVKHGDFDFIECKEGYILCYINAFQKRKDPKDVFYGVFYGTNHPLNTHGPVPGPQTLPHGKDNAILNVIRNFPKLEAKKLCICTDCTTTIRMMDRLPVYIENGYRNLTNGKILERKETYEQITAVIRRRDDLRIRFLYTPADVVFQMKEPQKLAASASNA